MNRTLRTGLAGLALLVYAGAAAGQTVPSSFQYIEKNRSLTVYGGYLFTDPSMALPDSQSAELGPQSAPLFGLRYALRVGGPLSVEANVGFSPAERKLYTAALNPDTSNVVVTPTGGTTSEPLVMGELGLRFHLTGDRTYRNLAPFVLASGGAIAGLGEAGEEEEDIPEHRRFDLGPSLAVGAGTGLDYFPSQRLSLRAELTYRLWRLRVPTGLLSSGSGQVKEWSANTGVSLGATYHF
jgi:hypothetical protein